MSKNKLDIKLGAVQETLLLPLLGRAELSKRSNSFFKDQMAIDIANRLNFNRKKAKKNMRESGVLAMAVRAHKMDRIIRNFLVNHPKGKILNIGAGLDTAFWRVDNGELTWYDLDLPDSMELRDKILPEHDRIHKITKSFLDFTWMDDLGSLDEGLLIQVPGVFPYFEQQDVMHFFRYVAPRLPNTEIVFDVVSPIGKRLISFGINRSGMERASLKWSISNAEEIIEWSNKIEIVKQESYFENISRKIYYSPLTLIAMNINDLMKIGQIFHLRFKA